jgi:peptidoglycan/xylan/chitin deacetylase (PgdA/CDA1 family)
MIHMSYSEHSRRYTISEPDRETWQTMCFSRTGLANRYGHMTPRLRTGACVSGGFSGELARYFSRNRTRYPLLMTKLITFALIVSGVLPVPCEATAQSHTVAMTVDDLPFVSGNPQPLNPSDAKRAVLVNEKILRAFASQHIPATGFVIEQHVQELGIKASTKILRGWIRPGFDLGNHMYSHPDVNSLSSEQVEQEITKGEATIGPLLESVSREPKFLRFPYNHTGDSQEKHDTIAAFMSAHGYRLAPCTIDNTDYKFNETYVLALARHDRQAAAKLRADYIAYTGAEIDWYTSLDKQVFGYEPPHVMLLHDSPLNGDTIEQVISLFRQRGYSFVTLTEALQDHAYSVPETFITKFGPMWGYRWAQVLHVKVSGRDEPDPPAWLDQYAKNRRVN